MKKSKFISVLLIMLFTLSLMSCTSSPEQSELVDYLNDEIPKLAALEVLVSEEYASVSMENYTNDEVMYASLVEKIIPGSLKLIAAVEGVTIEDDSLKEAHKIYLEAIEIQHSAFETMINALDDQDLDKIELVNEKLDEARSLMIKYTEVIEELADEYDVELKE